MNTKKFYCLACPVPFTAKSSWDASQWCYMRKLKNKFATSPQYIIKNIILQVHLKKQTSTEVIIYHIMKFLKMVMVEVVSYTPSRSLKIIALEPNSLIVDHLSSTSTFL
jgi:hypothetical protein